jgi:predicted alpha/beta superfamily hydrolase
MNIQQRLFVLLFFILVSFAPTAAAQDTVVNVSYQGKLDTIHSRVLDQDRQIQVFLPPNYKPGDSDKYDVLYSMDGGDYNLALINQVQRFLQWHDYMPQTIIVSVIEPDRNSDLTPTHLDTWSNSGNAVKFLSFIKTELIPYINDHYPSNQDNTIWGHSLSGMFVLYTLINEPFLFKSYIASDPSVWWDNDYVLNMAVAKLPAIPFEHTTFFIAGRDIDMTAMKIDTLEIILKKVAPPGLHWKVTVFPNETHSSVRLKSTYDGLKFSYEGHIKDMYFSPMNGMVVKDKPFKLYYSADTARIHYTIDGTVPTIKSPDVASVITVNGPATVTYKVFTNRERYNKITVGRFSETKLAPPISQNSKLKDYQPGGFNYAYYEGDWNIWPDLTKLKPVKTGITDSSFDPDKLPRKNHYALVIDGLLETEEEGYYVFALDGDPGSKLYIDNRLVIARDTFPQTFIIPLSKGFYPFRMEYLHERQEYSLDWREYLTPGIMESQNTILIPVNLQYGKR